MIRFLLIGTGMPAKAAVSAIKETPTASVVHVSSGRATGASDEMLDAQFIRQPAAVDWIKAQHFDWLISVNNLVIIPDRVLRCFAGRAVNCHPGILPEYAGVHTHQWAIRNGEREFGVTLHRMEASVDAGAIVAEDRFPIEANDTGLSLFTKCLRSSAKLIGAFISDVVAGTVPVGKPQCLARRRVYRSAELGDDRIDWSWPARRVIDFIRAGNYEPFASPTYTARMDVDGAEIEVLRAELGGPSTSPPGHIVDLLPDGPVVSCGDGQTIRVTRARKPPSRAGV